MDDARQLWFRSSFFAVEAGEDEETNPGCYGRALARWLGDRLRPSYPDVDVIAEDFGWCVMCARRPFSLWVACGNVSQQAGDALVWTVFVVAEQNWFQRLLRRVDTAPAADALYRSVEAQLRDVPDLVFCDSP